MEVKALLAGVLAMVLVVTMIALAGARCSTGTTTAAWRPAPITPR